MHGGSARIHRLKFFLSAEILLENFLPDYHIHHFPLRIIIRKSRLKIKFSIL
jgi:hypothetical protein